MRQFLIIGFIFLFSSAKASNYYFSTQSGSDLRDTAQAQNPATPWKSLAKLNSFFKNLKPGDSVLFKRGEVYRGYINAIKSGTRDSSIVFSTYGTGAKPVISGLQRLADWVSTANGIWASNTSSQDLILPSAGLTYKYYEGQWNQLPDFKKLAPKASGLVNNVDLEPRNSEDNFAILWEGQINISVAGTYYFETYSDDGSKLYIGSYDSSNNATVNNDGGHPTQYAGGSYTFSSPGKYPIAISYFNGSGGKDMKVFWTCAGAGISTRTPIPSSVFSQTGNAVPSGGLTYKYYEGVFTKLPNFKKMSPVTWGNVVVTSPSQRLRSENYAFLWEGRINIPVAGTYYFETYAKDGCKVYIGPYDSSATAFLSDDSIHPVRFAGAYYTFPLAGSYPIAISTFQTTGTSCFSLYWTCAAAGISRAQIPSSAYDKPITENVNFPAITNSLIINGIPLAMGRYPNSGYLNVSSHSGKTSFTDNTIRSGTSWLGAEAVIRKTHWILDRNVITNQSSSTFTVVPSNNGYDIQDNYGYFIQNHPSTLDQQGEWYLDPALKNMQLYWGNSDPIGSTIETSITDNLVTVYGMDNIVFDNLSFTGSNINTFDIQTSNNLTIQNCDITNAGTNAITAANTNYLKIQNNLIKNSQNNGLYLIVGCAHSTIINNKIINVGMVGGMGSSGDGTYSAINVIGNNNIVTYNEIDSIGYNAIIFYGDSCTVSNNYIHDFCTVKDDGGGIYVYKTGSNDINTGNVQSNIIINGMGAPSGTSSSTYRPVYGLYMDGSSNHLNLKNNTIANMGDGGIYIHDAHDMVVDGNVSFNNTTQFFARFDDPNHSIVSNITSTNNQFIAKTIGQGTVNFESIQNDLASFGTFNNNIYAKPISDQPAINIAYNNGQNVGQALDLIGWQQYASQDLASTKGYGTIPAYTVTNYTSVNKFTNGTFNANLNGLYIYSPLNNGVVMWDNTKLDTGALKVSFSPSNVGSSGAVLISVGGVDSGTQYILKFSVKGNVDKKQVQAYLRRSGPDYATISDIKTFRTDTGRTEFEYLLTCISSESDAVINFSVPEQSNPIWFDNISLTAANTVATNPDNYIRFEYNATKLPKTVSLDGTYIDVANKQYAGNVTLSPFTSLVLIKLSSNTSIANSVKKQAAALANENLSDVYEKLTVLKDFTKLDMAVYPNPSSNIINVSINVAAENVNSGMVYLTSSTGAVIKKIAVSISSKNSVIPINVSGLSAGTYHVSYWDGKKQLTSSFFKL